MGDFNVYTLDSKSSHFTEQVPEYTDQSPFWGLRLTRDGMITEQNKNINK